MHSPSSSARPWSLFLIVASALFVACTAAAQQLAALPGTAPLTMQGDLSAQMVAGIDAFLLRETQKAAAERAKFWKRDLASRDACEASIAPNRARFREIIGAVDARLPVKELEYVSTTATPAKVAETDRYTVFTVRWPLFEGVFAEGLLLEPKGQPRARVVALPDADQTPEQVVGLAPGVAPESQFARALAEHRCQVLVITLVDRRDNWSGSPALNRFTNQPHREWIYRQAFELGRHVIGYEVQKVLAAVDWFEHLNAAPAGPVLPIGVAGYGEGGLLALYSAALDPRVGATLVSGYFGSRQRVWEEPVYRNVWRLVLEFGDAEIASLSTRALFVEHSIAPKISGPPAPKPGRGAGAAPGRIETQEGDVVAAEVVRAREFFAGAGQPLKPIAYSTGAAGLATVPFTTPALANFIRALGAAPRSADEKPGAPPTDLRANFNPDERQQRAVKQLEAHTQRLLALCERTRSAFLWNKAKPTTPGEWTAAMEPFKKNFWDDVVGKFPPPTGPLNARARKSHDKPAWTGYEVVLDVWPDVFAWGVLLLPKDLKPGERRPVVVTQHGLEGVPEDTINEDKNSRAFAPYKAFSARLAEQGFIVFAPHNPYRGQDKFRTLQRKANPLGRSLFSVINAQHERILDWLSAQPFVDAQRIGFYGLSYGGKSAMRIPAALDRYALSICSADFNEWVKKNATVDWPFSYMFTGEYEIFEWNLGGTFNYAEMGALIAPRPFMVERGHNDGVGCDEFVAYEYAKIRRLYGYLGIPQQTEIEFFNGPHTINGVGTYEFLRKHLKWPAK